MNGKKLLAAALSTTTACWPLSVEASKRPRVPTMQDLATVWVGGNELEYLRLEVSESGIGVLTIQDLPHAPAHAYRVTRAVLHEYRVNFAVEPAEPKAEPITVGGTVGAGRLELRIAGRTLDWKRSIVLERLSDLMARLDAVTKRAQELSR